MATSLNKQQHTFIPTPFEAAGLIAVSVAVLVALTIVPIIRNINASTYLFFSDIVANRIDIWLDRFNTTRITALLTFVMWCMVGALAYLLVWSIISMFKSYKDDVAPFSGLIVPNGAVVKMSVATHLTRLYIRTVASIGLIFWTIFFFSEILPLCVMQFINALINIDGLSIVAVLLSVIYVSTSLFLFIVLIRLLLLRRRIFSSR